MTHANFLDEADHFCQLAAGNGGIFEDSCRRHTGQRAERGAAGAGEARGLVGIAGDLHIRRAALFGDLDHLRGLVFDGGGVSVGFHEQDGLGVARESDFGVVFHAVERDFIEEL